jgi:hypothetical protein
MILRISEGCWDGQTYCVRAPGSRNGPGKFDLWLIDNVSPFQRLINNSMMVVMIF